MRRIESGSQRLVDTVGHQLRVEPGDHAGGELGVESMDQRFVCLAAADDPDVLIGWLSGRRSTIAPQKCCTRVDGGVVCRGIVEG